MTKGLKPICFLDRTKVEETKRVRASPFKVTTVKKFEVRVPKTQRRRLFEEEEKEEGVGQVFPDAVSFCTNDHCQL